MRPAYYFSGLFVACALSAFFCLDSEAKAQADAQGCAPLDLLASFDLAQGPDGRNLYIPANLGGQEKLLLVTPFARYGVLSQEAVQELGLQPYESYFTLYSSTGDRSSEAVQVAPFEVGLINAPVWPFLINPRPNPNYAASPQFAGSLGSDFFGQLDVDIDFRANKMNIFSQGHCEGHVTYWEPNTVAVVPFQINDQGDFIIKAAIDGKEIDAVVKPDDPVTRLFLDVAVRDLGVDLSGADIKDEGHMIGRPSARVYSRNFETLSFEGVTVRNPHIVMMPDVIRRYLPDRAPTGSHIAPTLETVNLSIGYSVFRDLHVYIAFKEQKLYISPSKPTSVE